MTKRFGHTYWGNRWLSALQEIDTKKRLHLGLQPARKGSVTHFQEKEGKIFARVKSTGKIPHSQVIAVPVFSDREKTLITQTICNSPYLLSRVLSHELPPDLEEILAKINIRLFPRTWKELSLTCSCPDWLVPCPHISAVLYTVTREIDNNPFYLFQLRGLDLAGQLQQEGHTGGPKKNIFFSLDSLFRESRENSAPCPEQPPGDFAPDFSTIPQLRKSLLQVLHTNPLFYAKGDFKHLYTRALRLAGHYGTRLFEKGPAPGLAAPQDQISRAELDSLKKIIIKDDLVSSALLQQGEIVLDDNFLPFFDSYFRGLTRYDLEEAPETVRFLFQVYSFALVLLKQGAVVPQLLQLEPERFKIRWLPAVHSEEVKALCTAFTARMPRDFVLFCLDKQLGGREYTVPPAPQQFMQLVSLFLTSGLKTAAYRHTGDFDRICHLFFGNGIFSTAHRDEEKNIPQTVHLWLSRYHLIHKESGVLLKIEHHTNSYCLDLVIKRSSTGETDYLTLPGLFAQKDLQELQEAVARELELITHYIPQLKELYESQGKKPVTMGPEDFEDFFYNVLPVIKLLGIRLLVPRELYKVVNPRLTLELKAAESAPSSVSYFSLDTMLSFEWKIALGSTILAPGDFMKMVQGAAGIIQLQDQFVFIDPAQIDLILKKAREKETVAPKELVRAALDETFEEAPVSITPAARTLITRYRTLPELTPPDSLRAVLRPYQQTGFNWLYKNIRSRTGSLLADDMGLGKTIQVCALLAQLQAENYFLADKKCLIIVPTSLLTNWTTELARFTPDLSVTVYHGQRRQLELAEKDVIITTYGIVRSEQELFGNIRWKLVILDEAQNIKNPYSSQTKGIKKLEADHKIALSGTPVENRLAEFWSIFDFIQPGFLGSLDVFTREFSLPIEKYRNSKVTGHFKHITSPFILRRLKSDGSIINDLPDKLEFDEYCSLTPEQSALYQGLVNKTMHTIENSTGIERDGLILKMITGLKQICNHPAHYTGAHQLNPDKSGKTLLLLELLEKIISNHEKVLIFTQFSRMGELLTGLIKSRFNLDTPFLHGAISRNNRDAMVKQFQEDEKTRAFILSLLAGGTGLNLTSASFVIHFDLWWNPAVESQATDRAYRIGQKKNVMVYRFITKGTFEEKINAVLREKKELADLAVSSGRSWLSELSDFELQQMVRLE